MPAPAVIQTGTYHNYSALYGQPAVALIVALRVCFPGSILMSWAWVGLSSLPPPPRAGHLFHPHVLGVGGSVSCLTSRLAPLATCLSTAPCIYLRLGERAIGVRSRGLATSARWRTMISGLRDDPQQLQQQHVLQWSPQTISTSEYQLFRLWVLAGTRQSQQQWKQFRLFLLGTVSTRECSVSDCSFFGTRCSSTREYSVISAFGTRATCACSSTQSHFSFCYSWCTREYSLISYCGTCGTLVNSSQFPILVLVVLASTRVFSVFVMSAFGTRTP